MRAEVSLALVGMVACVATANADVVTVEYLSRGEGRTVEAQRGSLVRNIFVGQLVHEFSNGTGQGELIEGTMISFCSDFNDRVATTPTVYDVVPVTLLPDDAPMGNDRAAAIDRIYTEAAGAQFGSNADDIAAAFQLAIWEIIYDFDEAAGRSSLNVAAGEFQARSSNGSPLSAGITTQLDRLLDAAVSGQGGNFLLGLRSDSRQDQLVLVPAPGAIALAGLGGLLAARRRRSA
ncbi:MAG: hypothetical protein SFZ23_12400 [Planctomycetota bacterium]|nr:hypothetical protein [Planctomycetota bacterium]